MANNPTQFSIHWRILAHCFQLSRLGAGDMGILSFQGWAMSNLLTCRRCGERTPELFEHLQAAHGFVPGPLSCVALDAAGQACGKVGIYKVGGCGYCRARKAEASNRRAAKVEMLEATMSTKEAYWKAKERHDINSRNAKSAAKFGHR